MDWRLSEKRAIDEDKKGRNDRRKGLERKIG
jgi:hypothetical protein